MSKVYSHDSYWMNGMGLHSSQIGKLFDILMDDVKNVVEFGSGNSTQFLVDARKEHDLNFQIHSFDHHPDYCYNQQHDFLKSHRRDLVQCSDMCFEDMFKNGEYDEKCFVNRQEERDNFSARNCFYDMTENDLPDDIDLVILDGPNGNGRSIAFLHLKNKLSNGAYILIDDSDHYDFIERCKQVLDVDLVAHENNPSIHPLFNYALLKVVS